MKRAMTVVTAGLVVMFVLTATARAQGAAGKVELGKDRGKVILSWDEFVKITGYDPSRKGSQVVTVPWKDIQSLLNVEVKGIKPGTTVDLPWREFKELMKWSIERKGKEDKSPPPPTDYIITSSEYAGEIGEKSAQFTLKLNVNILRKKGWKRIPVLPAGVAVIKCEFKPADGVYLNTTASRSELLTQKTGPIEVTVRFAVDVTKSGGINQLGFARGHTGSSVLDLTIDREDVDVKVARAQSVLTTKAAGKTKVAAALPSGFAVQISWERALPKVEAVPPKLYAETRTLVGVAEGMLLCQEMVTYNILHTPVRELKLTVPAGVNVLTVNGPNVSDWRVKGGELQVQLRKDAIGAYGLYITFEQTAVGKVVAPVVRATGVQRERGYIGVIAIANVELSADKVSGATTIDTRRLPGDIVAMTKQPILLAFRYIGEKFSIPLAIKKHDEVSVLVTIVDRGLLTAMQLPDGRRMTRVIYSVRNNRKQFLRAKMPEGAEIWSVSVSGNTATPAKDNAGNVLIPLIRSARGARELAAFPVEIVYVETPAKVAPAKGALKVTLPTLDAPTMHVMYSYYLPPEGKYGVTAGLFGTARSGFTGPMHLVKEFTTLSSGPGPAVVRVDAPQQVARMQQQFDQRAVAQARAAGAKPIRVRLPINGKLFKLEKILALPLDKLYFELQYSGWKVAK